VAAATLNGTLMDGAVERLSAAVVEGDARVQGWRLSRKE